MSSNKPALGRRRLGVTIRLLIVLLMAGVLSWVGVALYSARQQRKAVQAIVESGGEVGYDYEYLPNGYPSPSPTPPGPEWCLTLFGRDVLADVVVVDIPNDPMALTYLARFPKLRDLYVGGARAGEVLPITDDDLGQLEHLANLRVLSLSHCQITDAALWHIGKCAGLEHLYLSHTPITCAGLRHLVDLDELRGIALEGTNVTDHGVGDLGSLRSLAWIDLSDTRIGDGWLQHVGKHGDLQSLCLSGTDISDGGLSYLGALSKLKTLFLSRTNVSDVGLKHVATLESLRFLTVTATRVTKEGVSNLRHALPNCTIRSDSVPLREQGKDDIPD